MPAFPSLSNQHAVDVLFLAAGTLLIAAQALGSLCTRFRQPAVFGELIAGVLLGPTVLGALWPAAEAYLFPPSGPLPTVLDGITSIAICLFLLVAGMEVDLLRVLKLRRAVGLVGIGGLLLPFAFGFTACWLAPHFFGLSGRVSPALLAAIVASALSITALPVIVKILRDLDLHGTDLGAVVIAAAVFNDLIGWFVFGLLLGLIQTDGGSPRSPANALALTLLFVVFTLTVVRWIANHVLRWFAAHARSQRAVIGSLAGIALLYAYFAGLLGVHANFGAFLLGVALGDSRFFPERARHTMDQFVSQVLAPLFFAAIGLKLNFAEHFELPLVLAVILLATVSKVAGSAAGARMAGFDRRPAMAIGFGMNARGAVEIVLALLALEAQVISEELFVALITMAIVTSALSGGLMRRTMRQEPAGAG